MIRMVVETMGVGFLIGLVIAALLQWFGAPLFPGNLMLLPLFAGLLSGFGTLVSLAVGKALEGRFNQRTLAMIAFASAALINALFALFLLRQGGGILLSPLTLVVLFLGLALGGLYALFADRRQREKERLVMLEKLTKKQEMLTATQRKLAMAEERRRISRELHDGLSQGLHGLVYTVDGLERALERGKPVDDYLAHLKETAKETQKELRVILEALTPSALEKSDLCQALEDLAKDLEKRDLAVVCDLQACQGLSPSVEIGLYRMAQEMATNVLKHSGASQVSLSLTKGPEGLHFEMADDGCGFDEKAMDQGRGLLHLEARAREIGAHLKRETSPGKGTRYLVDLD